MEAAAAPSAACLSTVCTDIVDRTIPLVIEKLTSYIDDLVATRLPDTRALQNGGVGDQLSDRLQRIEDSQERLVELAVAEYIKQNEGSVRAAKVKQYSKANRHDQAFVAEAQRACEGVSEGSDASLSNSDWVQKLILQEERCMAV